jgi:outer membrane protein assembly factor BamE (lipoprotein component of BamABCDE complex)
MKRFSIFLILIVFLIIGCATTQTAKMITEQNTANLHKLRVGMTEAEVKKIMGKPDFKETYPTAGGISMSVYYYFTNDKNLDESITKDECTRLLFEKDILSYVGK